MLNSCDYKIEQVMIGLATISLDTCTPCTTNPPSPAPPPVLLHVT